ncbi:hypothetical protein C770_GR4pB247 (plasmid) [Sinorhizobium meliloti GR4]|nr:hypothetical protein C770_GR4pB247 [Sinorhizobium meliloti GR4]
MPLPAIDQPGPIFLIALATPLILVTSVATFKLCSVASFWAALKLEIAELTPASIVDVEVAINHPFSCLGRGPYTENTNLKM